MPLSRPSLALITAALLLKLPPALPAAATGADFLLVEPGARAAALAGAYGAEARDLDCLRYNPAGLSGQTGFRAAVSHQAAPGDWTHDWAALGMDWGSASLGLELVSSSLSAFQLYDANGQNDGMAGAGSLNVMLAGALPLNRWLHLGAGFRAFNSHLYTYTSQGYAGDFGLQVRQRDWPVQAGLALQNLGSESAYIQQADPLPLCVRASLASHHALEADLTVRPHADLLAYMDPSRPLELRLGLEAELYHRAFLRGGWLRADSYQQMSLGLGFKVGFLEVDYCFQPQVELGASHLLSLHLKTGA